ncbi:MAG: hypothetical protein EA384_09935 [Spirochaetaceae bacterium]|nr:MAG: hypothetical protein EA384_09935 [Spirochaetaceae bacterium]
MAIEDQDQPITELRIQYRGLEFVFNSNSSVSLESDDGAETMLAVVGYSRLDHGFEVQLEDDVRLQFLLTGEDAAELHIRPHIPVPLPGASRITIPFATVGGARTEQEAAGATLPVRYDSTTFLLAPPPRSVVNGSALRLPADVHSQTVRYTAMEADEEDAVTRWFSDRSLAIADQDYEAFVRNYIERGYVGWRSGRFNAASGTWDMREGSPQFREEILTATLAEAWRRDQYGQAFAEMRRAADRHADQIGLLSSAYLGNLRELKLRVQAADSATTRQLLTAAEQRDADLFRTDDLMTFALHRGSRALADAIIAFAAELDYRDLDLFQTVGLLQNAHMADPVSAEAERAFARFDSVIEKRILPAVIRIDEGFFLQSTPGQIDMLLSVRAGVILEHKGRRRGDAILIDVGRNLVVSALSLADQEGFLPRVLISAGGGFQSSDGAIGPEDLYPYLHDNPSYPHLVSLYDEIGPGTWMWTVATVSAIRVTDQQISFAVQAPVNRTHYLVVQGIPPFRSMQLFGLEWRNDPSFEAYARGRHYNPQTRSLLIKYTDTVPQRRVALNY